jgi:hypothetical protein
MSKIKVERQPSPARLQELGVKSWPIWTKEASEFPWTYDESETCYFLEGEVTVTCADGETASMGDGGGGISHAKAGAGERGISGAQGAPYMTNKGWMIKMEALIILFTIVLFVNIVTCAFLVLSRKRARNERRAKTMEYIHPSIFGFFTTLYAFFLTFSIATLWSAFLTTKTNVGLEAGSLMMAYDFSKNLPQGGEFRNSLRNYVKSILEDEWRKMEEGKMSEASQQNFDKVWDNLRQLEAQNKIDSNVYTTLSNYLNIAGQNRLSRLQVLKGNLYPPFWAIIIVGFITVIYLLFFASIEQNVTRIIFEGLVIFIMLSCIYFIIDINTPFSGFVTVKPEVFKYAYHKMLLSP